MALIRCFTKVDKDNKIAVPLNIIQGLKLSSGQILELKVAGAHNTPYLHIQKRKYVR